MPFWRRKWQTTLVLLPGESGCKELDTTERLTHIRQVYTELFHCMTNILCCIIVDNHFCLLLRAKLYGQKSVMSQIPLVQYQSLTADAPPDPHTATYSHLGIITNEKHI